MTFDLCGMSVTTDILHMFEGWTTYLPILVFLQLLNVKLRATMHQTDDMTLLL